MGKAWIDWAERPHLHPRDIVGMGCTEPSGCMNVRPDHSSYAVRDALVALRDMARRTPGEWAAKIALDSDESLRRFPGKQSSDRG